MKTWSLILNLCNTVSNTFFFIDLLENFSSGGLLLVQNKVCLRHMEFICFKMTAEKVVFYYNSVMSSLISIIFEMYFPS